MHNLLGCVRDKRLVVERLNHDGWEYRFVELKQQLVILLFIHDCLI